MIRKALEHIHESCDNIHWRNPPVVSFLCRTSRPVVPRVSSRCNVRHTPPARSNSRVRLLQGQTTSAHRSCNKLFNRGDGLQVSKIIVLSIGFRLTARLITKCRGAFIRCACKRSNATSFGTDTYMLVATKDPSRQYPRISLPAVRWIFFRTPQSQINTCW